MYNILYISMIDLVLVIGVGGCDYPLPDPILASSQGITSVRLWSTLCYSCINGYHILLDYLSIKKFLYHISVVKFICEFIELRVQPSERKVFSKTFILCMQWTEIATFLYTFKREGEGRFQMGRKKKGN